MLSHLFTLMCFTLLTAASWAAPLNMEHLTFAGSTSSGGGELLSDALNPWFLENTKSISYCILLDQAHFGLELEDIKSNLRDAMDYWREEFAIAESFAKANGRSIPVRIVVPHLIEKSCNAEVDLIFQFGVLNDEQEKFLGDATRIVGMAVRTDYDKVLLKGKGYIYISPESGRLALTQEGIVPQRWSRDGGRRFKLILIHELGHVFGIPHSHDGIEEQDSDVMGADFAKRLTDSKEMIYGSYLSVPHFFAPPENWRFGRCRGLLGQKIEQIFGVPKDWECLKFEAYGSPSDFRVYARTTRQTTYQLIGSYSNTQKYLTSVSAVTLVTSPAQRVLNHASSEARTLQLYPRMKVKGSGTFTSSDSHLVKSVIYDLDAGSLFISAFHGNGVTLGLFQAAGWEMSPIIIETPQHGDVLEDCDTYLNGWEGTEPITCEATAISGAKHVVTRPGFKEGINGFDWSSHFNDKVLRPNTKYRFRCFDFKSEDAVTITTGKRC